MKEIKQHCIECKDGLDKVCDIEQCIIYDCQDEGKNYSDKKKQYCLWCINRMSGKNHECIDSTCQFYKYKYFKQFGRQHD